MSPSIYGLVYLESIESFYANAYNNTTRLVIEHVDKHAATHGERGGSKKSCKKSVYHDALNVFRNCHSKLENCSSKGGNDKG